MRERWARQDSPRSALSKVEGVECNSRHLGGGKGRKALCKRTCAPGVFGSNFSWATIASYLRRKYHVSAQPDVPAAQTDGRTGDPNPRISPQAAANGYAPSHPHTPMAANQAHQPPTPSDTHTLAR